MLPLFRSQLDMGRLAFCFHAQVGLQQSQYRVVNPSCPPLRAGSVGPVAVEPPAAVFAVPPLPVFPPLPDAGLAVPPPQRPQLRSQTCPSGIQDSLQVPQATHCEQGTSGLSGFTLSVHSSAGGLPPEPDTLPPELDTLPPEPDTLPPELDTLPPELDTLPPELDTLPPEDCLLPPDWLAPPELDTLPPEDCLLPPDWFAPPDPLALPPAPAEPD